MINIPDGLITILFNISGTAIFIFVLLKFIKKIARLEVDFDEQIHWDQLNRERFYEIHKKVRILEFKFHDSILKDKLLFDKVEVLESKIKELNRKLIRSNSKVQKVAFKERNEERKEK